MLHTALSDDEQAIAELAHNVAMSLLDPGAGQADRGAVVPEGLWRKVLATGLAGPYLDNDGRVEVNSAGMQLIAVEKLSFGDPGIALASAWSGCAAMLLAEHGTAQQVALAAELTRRPGRASIAMYEGYGRGPGEFATTITRQPDGSAHVRGEKVAVPFARFADPLVVLGSDSVTHAPAGAITRSDAGGVTVRSHRSSSALRAAATATVMIDVTVPPEDVLGRPNLDPAGLTGSINRMRLLVAAAAIGTGQRAVEYAADYATGRIAFGRPIASFQGVSFPLAESHMRLHQARLEIAAVAAYLDEGRPNLDGEVSDAIRYATEAASEATRTAVQTLGGHGFMLDYPVERWYRAAAALSTLDFDPERSSFSPAL
jgi:alkylation response protein AidB-like acyl-CoA dehydrogenase